MFNNLGWEEILVLALVGLIIFGPDRLPKAVQDATRVLRQLRTMARGAADDLRSELGPEIADLDIRSFHPRRIVQDALFGDDEPATAGVAPSTSLPLADNERPPFDTDAT
jgi:sec-independent protein translocase protein TatB